MKVVYNRWIPFRGYVAMTVLFWVFVREEYRGRLDARTLNHEKIHCAQQVELWCLAAAVFLACCLFGLSWWWLAASPVVPLALYVFCWFVEIVLPPYDRAYKDICFEREAKRNEGDLEYLEGRKPFAWFCYLFRKGG